MTTLLRRLFVREPELNPASPFDSPPLFTLLRVFLQCMILGIALIAFGSAANVRASYAGFVLTLIVLSPNTASYTFLLLVLPTALLLEGSTLRQKIALLLCFFAVAIPMRPSWSWLFPKVWLLGVLFVLALLLARMAIGRRQALIAISTAAALSLAVAGFTLVTYGKETNRRWQRITVAKNQIGRSNTSPDGRWMVFAQESSRSTQIYLLDRKNGHTRQVTHGDCNSFAPAWERNFAAIVFASDCGRGLGMPAHYRAALTEIVKDS